MLLLETVASIDVMVPPVYLEMILEVWGQAPLMLSEIECRASSTMIMASQSLRSSSRAWLRVLCQETLYHKKHRETKCALMTVPYLNLPSVINMDILQYLVFDEFHMSQLLREVAIQVQVPRSIVSIQEGSVSFKYRQARDELHIRLRAETVLHNRIRARVSELMQANLLSASHNSILRRRAMPYF